MYFFQVLFSLLGRMVLGAVFIGAGVKHILNWKASEEILVTALCDLHVYAGDIPYAGKGIEFSLNWVPVLLGIAVGLMLVGGLFVFFGFRAKWGAFLLMLFLIPATFVMHPFWAAHAYNQQEQEIAFIKNTAIFGGLLMVLAHGNSLRRKRKPIPEPPLESRR